MKKLILIVLFFGAVQFISFAQNLFIKPFGGSMHGFSSVEKKFEASEFDVYNLNGVQYLDFSGYFGLALEYQKDVNNRLEFAIARHRISLGHQVDYTSSFTGNTTSYRQHAIQNTYSLSFNYARRLLQGFKFKTGKTISFDGVLGGSLIRGNTFQTDETRENLGNIQDLHTLERTWRGNEPNSFALNLGFATRLHNAKGNAILELRFQYTKSFVEMKNRQTIYTIYEKDYEFIQTSNGSTINFAFGIPIKVLSFKKNKKAE